MQAKSANRLFHGAPPIDISVDYSTALADKAIDRVEAFLAAIDCQDFAGVPGDLPLSVIVDDAPICAITDTSSLKQFRWIMALTCDPKKSTVLGQTLVGVDNNPLALFPDSNIADMITDPLQPLAAFEGDDDPMDLFVETATALSPELTREIYFVSEETSRAIEMRFELWTRYDLPTGFRRTLLRGMMLDVGREYKERCLRARDRINRDIIDHRFGNLLRIAQLELETGNVEGAVKLLGILTTEVDIRRGLVAKVPFVPLSIAELIQPLASSLTLTFEGDATTQLEYSALDGSSKIQGQVLQVRLFMDVVSNAVKHSDGALSVDVRRDAQTDNRSAVPTTMIFSNNRSRKLSRISLDSLRTGLGALQSEAKEIGVSIDFDQGDASFTVCVHLLSLLPEIDATGPLKSPHKPTNDKLLATAADYAWCIVDDSATIASLFKKHMEKAYGVSPTCFVTPADVGCLQPGIWQALQAKRPEQHGLIVLMDENLFELDQEFEIVQVTGTELRRRLLTRPKLRAAHDTRTVIFVSASSNEVDDPSCLVNVGKAGTTARMVAKVMTALQSKLVPRRPSTQRPSSKLGAVLHNECSPRTIAVSFAEACTPA